MTQKPVQQPFPLVVDKGPRTKSHLRLSIQARPPSEEEECRVALRVGISLALRLDPPASSTGTSLCLELLDDEEEGEEEEGYRDKNI